MTTRIKATIAAASLALGFSTAALANQGIPVRTHQGTGVQCFSVDMYDPSTGVTTRYGLALRNPNAPYDPNPIQNRTADQLGAAVLDTVWDSSGNPQSGKLFSYLPTSNPTQVCSGGMLPSMIDVNYPADPQPQ